VVVYYKQQLCLLQNILGELADGLEKLKKYKYFSDYASVLDCLLCMWHCNAIIMLVHMQGIRPVKHPAIISGIFLLGGINPSWRNSGSEGPATKNENVFVDILLIGGNWL